MVGIAAATKGGERGERCEGGEMKYPRFPIDTSKPDTMTSRLIATNGPRLEEIDNHMDRQGDPWIQSHAPDLTKP